MQIRFGVWPEPLTGVDRRGRPTKIAGHPGLVEPFDGTSHTVLVAATTSADKPGALAFSLVPGPLAHGQLPKETADKAEPILADIVARHFTP